MQLTGNVLVAWGEGAEATAIACSVLEVPPCARMLPTYQRPVTSVMLTFHTQTGALEPRALTARDAIMVEDGGRATVLASEGAAAHAVSDAQ